HTFDTGGSCPDISNFSYPSNHTVIAFGLAMGLAFAIPWLSYLVFPVAILEAISRVLAGHHYPHDVLVGAVVGAFTVIGLSTCSLTSKPRWLKSSPRSGIKFG